MAIGDESVLRSSEDDVTMEDLGGGHPHTDRPPEKRVSWAQKVIGGSRRIEPRPETVLDDVFVEERVILEFPDGTEGEPAITIGEEVLKAMNDLWKKCIIVRVLGRSVNLETMDRK